MPETSLEAVKFLLVDDLDENLVALAALLRRPELKLHAVQSGTQALELLLKHDFALAIIDVHMPDMDGFELAELLRGTERCKHLPIIFATAAPREQHRVFKGYESGAVDFLFKPIDPHVLRHKAEVFFELYRQRQLLSLQVAEHERLLAETRETLRMNEMFTAALSHDLRTPLNAVIAGAALIQQTGTEPVTKKVADRILSSGRRMSEMIEQLLDLSRARLSGGIGIAPQATDLRVLGERIVNEVQAVSPAAQIELGLVGELRGEWDEARLGQVLSNLLTNAIRHGAPGTIRIQLSGAEPDHVTLTVQNAGTIADEVRGQLFDPFRAGSKLYGQREGLGLGLYIVKQIVEAHAGSIEAESDASFGTRFVIRLPRSRELILSDTTQSDAKALRQRLIVAIATPLLLLLAAGTLLAVQIQTLTQNAEWVDHSDAVIANTYEAIKGIIDQETGLRGFILTEDPVFLEPYRRAAPEHTLDELRELLTDNPVQVRRARLLSEAYTGWLSVVSPVVESGDVREARTRSAMLARKQRMDRVREIAHQILEAESSIRASRARDLAFTRSVTLVGSAFLLAACGLAIAFVARRQLTGVASTYDTALAAERETKASLAIESWVRAEQVALATAVQGDIPVAEVCARALTCLAKAARADVGAVYVQEGKQLRRVAAYAHTPGSGTGPVQFELGEGLLGQAALDNRIVHLKDVPADYLVVRSGTGQRDASELLLLPASIEGRVHAVVELGFLTAVEERTTTLCERAGEILAVAIRSAEYRGNLREYLEETQRQAEELATQQEELRVTNEELAEQGNVLREAHQKMELAQAELEQTNSHLSRQATLLEHHNDELRKAQEDLATKAAEVARANQYKSEFLANMSHELRTPLNSTLILAKLLADNKDANLNTEQVKFAETIYSAGNDLLVLINDVLDLSRIEAGKMEVHVTAMPFARILEPVQRTFEPVARQKGVRFEVQIDHNGIVETDSQRLRQIVRNLLSNAFKFTEHGQVSLRAQAEGDSILISVRDSGIGIADEHLETIFEAFRQADGTTHRKYGGTGLGLSISRDLAHLLGGDLVVSSQLGQGSTFTLTLPRKLFPHSSEAARVEAAPALQLAALSAKSAGSSPLRNEPPSRSRASVPDDRGALAAGRRVLLIVEDDSAFANVLVELGHDLDFQCLAAETADEGLRLAAKFPPSAIILDIALPDHSGLSVLDRLKRDPATRHIPVHVISATDNAQTALSMGAVGYALKPVAREKLVRAVQSLKDTFSKEQRVVLVVEDDAVQRDSVAKLLSAPGIEIVAVETVEEALSELRQRTFDCIVTDLSFPSASGYDLLETLAHDEGYAFPPVIVYTGRSLTAEEEQRLRRYSSSIIVKGARSPERLLDEVTLFLHQVESTLPPDRQRMLRAARDREALFEGRTILVAEDDVRNVFALVSVLEPRGAKVEIARNGREALERLEQSPDIALVLMDIMMPEMDGLTAMREIRKRREWQKLPIIALTAKAMPDDQEKCLNAGANDYVSKPFEVDMLLSLMRVWLSR